MRFILARVHCRKTIASLGPSNASHPEESSPQIRRKTVELTFERRPVCLNVEYKRTRLKSRTNHVHSATVRNKPYQQTKVDGKSGEHAVQTREKIMEIAYNRINKDTE